MFSIRVSLPFLIGLLICIFLPQSTLAQGDIPKATNVHLFSETSLVFEDKNAKSAFLAAESVTIKEAISDDAYAIGMKILSMQNIADDAFFIGNSIKISGEIGGNLYILGADVEIMPTAKIAGSLYGFANELKIHGSIGNNSWIRGDTLQVSSHINGNLDAHFREYSISPQAHIKGNFVYSAEKEIEGLSIVQGKTLFTPKTQNTLDTQVWISLIITFVTSFTLILFLYFFIGKKIITSDWLYKDSFQILGKGFLLSITLPILILLGFISQIAIWISFVFLLVFFLLWIISSSLTIVYLLRLCTKSQHTNIHLAFLALIALLYALISFIPPVFFLLMILGSWFGFGLSWEIVQKVRDTSCDSAGKTC